MKLYYKHDNLLEYIGDFTTQKDALKEIYAFWKKLGYTLPYTRSVLHNGYTIFDIGFYGRFYELYKDGYEPANMKKIERKNKMIKVRGFEAVSDKMRKTTGEITLPKKGTSKAIAYDIYSPIDVTIPPMESCMIWTDVKAYFQDNEALLINVRSSMGKQPVIIAHNQGWVECDYYDNPQNEGNLGVNLFNLGKTDYVIKHGDRIAQAMFIHKLDADNGDADTVRQGGFGSTNANR